MAPVLGRPKREIPASYATYNQWYYHTVVKMRGRPSRRKDNTVQCRFCDIPLVSNFGSKQGTKYCDSCRESAKVKKILNAEYAKRYYRKVHGVTEDKYRTPYKYNIAIPTYKYKSIWRQMEMGVK